AQQLLALFFDHLMPGSQMVIQPLPADPATDTSTAKCRPFTGLRAKTLQREPWCHGRSLFHVLVGSWTKKYDCYTLQRTPDVAHLSCHHTHRTLAPQRQRIAQCPLFAQQKTRH
ncbi:hypothetical protein BaRGS_00029334, partial [Batillaria attramentaria]